MSQDPKAKPEEAQADQKGQAKKGFGPVSGYFRIMTAASEGISTWLSTVGSYTAKHPVLVLVCSIIGVLICSSGLLYGLFTADNFLESNTERLWIPRGTQSSAQQDWVMKNFNEVDQVAAVIVETKDGRKGEENILTPEAVDELFQLFDKILDIDAGPEKKKLKFEDICLRDYDKKTCYYLPSVLGFWEFSYEKFKESVMSKKNDKKRQEQFLKDVNQEYYKTASGQLGRLVVLNSTFGTFDGDVKPQGKYKATYADTLRVSLLFTRETDINGVSRDEYLDDKDGWYAKFVELLDIYDPENDAYIGDNGENAEPGTLILKHIRPTFFHIQTVDQALQATIETDIFLVFIVFVLVYGTTTAMMSKWQWVFSRGSLGICGVTIALFSIGAAYGLTSYMGIPITVLSQVLPFIILGIGVDDVFVIVHALDEVDRFEPWVRNDLVYRFRRALQLGGASITVTSFTDVAAFLVGSISNIPAVQWFCWQAALVIFVNYILQITMFLAIFVLTERRKLAGRYDCCCCFGEGALQDPVQALRTTGHVDPNVTSIGQMARQVSIRARQLSATNSLRRIQNIVRPPGAPTKTAVSQRLLSAYYKNFLIYTPVKILILVVFLGAFALGIYGGFTQLQQGLNYEDLAPRSHYIQDYQGNLRETFQNFSPKDTYLYFRHIDPFTVENQARMLYARDYVIANSSYIFDGLPAPPSWQTELVSLIDQIQTNDFLKNREPGSNVGGLIIPPRDALNEAIYLGNSYRVITKEGFEWVQSELLSSINDDSGGTELFDQAEVVGITGNPSVFNDLAFDKSGKNVVAVRFPLYQTPRAGERKFPEDALNAYLDVAKEVNEFVFRDVPQDDSDKDSSVAFIFQLEYLFFEAERVLFQELLSNLGLALLGTVLVNVFMLVHPMAALLMALAVLMVDGLLFLEMWVLSIPFNTISVVNLVMAIGLAVDYSVHVAHKFLSTEGKKRDSRMHESMRGIGAAVAMGAMTTIIAVLPLSGARSEVFLVFFKLLFGTAVFGLLVGMVFMPVVLSLVGPKACLKEPELEGRSADDSAMEPAFGPGAGQADGPSMSSIYEQQADNAAKKPTGLEIVAEGEGEGELEGVDSISLAGG